MACTCCFAWRCSRGISRKMHMMTHWDALVTFLTAHVLMMLVEHSLVILHVLVLQSLLWSFELACQRLCWVEIYSLCDIFLALASQCSGSSLVCLICLIEINDLLIGLLVLHGKVRERFKLITLTRDESTIIIFLSFCLHQKVYLFISKTLRV